jgi:hypothetical protein
MPAVPLPGPFGALEDISFRFVLGASLRQTVHCESVGLMTRREELLCVACVVYLLVGCHGSLPMARMEALSEFAFESCLSRVRKSSYHLG